MSAGRPRAIVSADNPRNWSDTGGIDMALDQGGTAAQAGNSAAPNVRAMIVSIGWDIVLTTSIPLACYWMAKRFFGATERGALLVATIFPLFQSAAGVARRELDPIASSLVTLGTGGLGD